MSEKPPKMCTCQVCHQELPMKQLYPVELFRASVHETARTKYPNWDEHGYVCFDDLRGIRALRIESVLTSQRGKLTPADQEVVDSLKSQEILSEDINKAFETSETFGEKASDHVAMFGGSWRFIGLFAFFILVWVLFNNKSNNPYDPYPYILLNLFLSCIAAFQAPIIMMSQNRQADKDRLRDTADYQVNLKAELEILQLHAKLDTFMQNEWQRLLELQKLQIEIAEDIVELTEMHKHKKMPVNTTQIKP
jgi:uncharacterized membrane protein